MSSVDLKSKVPNPFFPGVYDVNAQDVLALKKELVLIDVRESSEFTGELGHIADSSLIPLGSLPDRLHEIPQDKTVIFICRSGNRSAHAAAFALEHGYKDVFNMAGGMLFWNSIMLPVERN